MDEYYTFSDLVEVLLKETPNFVVQRYILDIFPYCFKDSPELYWDLRERICSKFDLHPQNFSLAGSGKLGFSLSPTRLGNPFYDGSDIDIILVSDALFNTIWSRLILFGDRPDYKLHSSSTRQTFNKLQSQVFLGHISLELLTKSFDFAKEWWEFFNTLSADDRYGPRQINAMVFKNWLYVNRFYERTLRQIKDNQK